MPKILVTGATGFLGSRLVRLLVKQGHDVKLLVRPDSSLRAIDGVPRNRMTIAAGDIMVEHEVYRALAGCDRLLHVAAVFKMWARQPQEILDAAVLGTQATLSAARKRGTSRIVVTSSVAAVGVNAEPVPLSETSPFNLRNSETYIIAKRRAENVAMEFAAQGTPVVVVNPGAIFGPGDWKPTPSGASLLAYLRWGWPIRFPSMVGGISAVDVDDVAAGHILAMEKGRVGERYILGGDNLTFDQMFTMLSEITGLRGPGKKSSRRVAMVAERISELGAWLLGGEPLVTYKLAGDDVGMYAWVTSEKAERELGYRHRPAREAFERAVRWVVYHGCLDDRALRRLRLDFGGG